MPRLELFPFRYRDPRTGKWIRARVQPLQDDDGRRTAAIQRAAAELQPAIDAAEAFLPAVFLRRYVTYCARRSRYASDEWGGGCTLK